MKVPVRASRCDRLAATRNFPVEKKVPLREWPKLTAFANAHGLQLDAVPQGGVAGGNLRATVTLLVLLGLTTVLALAVGDTDATREGCEWIRQ